MELWHAVILGLVEGITEYLPVSSTGHLILTSALLGLDETPQQKEAVDAFNIVIQGGAILAVLGLYWPRVVQMLKGLLGKDRDGRRLAINIVIAFLPAAVLGVLLDDLIEAWLFHAVPVLAALALGGVYMILLDRWKIRVHLDADPEHDETTHTRDITDLTWRQALIIGFMQTLAMIPGTSRSMMTITAGVLVGLKPKQAAEFSFLLGLPTLGGACVYKLAKNLNHADDTGTPNMFDVIGWIPIIAGLLVATVSAALAVRWLVAFLTRHGLEPFGWYRLALAAVLAGAIATGWVEIDAAPADTSVTAPDATPP